MVMNRMVSRRRRFFVHLEGRRPKTDLYNGAVASKTVLSVLKF